MEPLSDVMLFGANIASHTDHKNLTFTTPVNNCVIPKLNFGECFTPTYLYITGDDNFLADIFSHLSRLSDANIPVDLEE